MTALSDVRVLDLSRLLPGGFCSLLLADLGADVLKVEDTGAGDYVRWSPPFYAGAEESAGSALFLALNRNKRSMRINLKTEPGREVLLRLVREYDVVLESLRPGVLDRLGVGYACADGWVTLGALEPKFWAAWCAGVGREDLVERQFDRVGSEAHRAVAEVFAGRTREEWRAFGAAHDCCLEPVLELDEALRSELARAREMVVGLDQPGVEQAVRLLGLPVKLSRAPGDPNRLPGPALGEHTDEVLRGLGYSDEERARLAAAGAVAGRPSPPTGSFRA